MNNEPTNILDKALDFASKNLSRPLIKNKEILGKVELICKSPSNRACSRFLLACLLAKLHNPKHDIRKPYTEIGTKDSYSGRHYDEAFISPFIVKNDLPCNYTTAFLTPAFRNRNIILGPKINLVGRPAEIYKAALELLDEIHSERIKTNDLLTEVIRSLLLIRKERLNRMTNLLDSLKQNQQSTILSAEGIITLIQQHLNCPNSSRLPVLVVVAIYKTAENNLGERVLPLHSHLAADKQTGSLGDVQITLIDDEKIVTSYEMKDKTVVQGDVDSALKKIAESKVRIDNYIIVTTEPINPVVNDYAKSMYEKSGGIEIAILDCLGTLRHFLHLFYRLRAKFLDEYQKLVLAEPDSAVRAELKEAFIALRKASESMG